MAPEPATSDRTRFSATSRRSSAIDGLGLEIDEMLVMVETLDAFTRGRTLEDLSEQEAVRRSGLDQAEWMRDPGPLHRESD